MEVRLLLGVVAAYRRHCLISVTRSLDWLMLKVLTMSCLLGGIHWLAGLPWVSRLSRLSWSHKHNRLWRLARLGILVHHHWSSSTRAWKPTMGLRGWPMLRINVTRVWRIHLHLRAVGRNAHIRATGRLLYHHWCCHSLWVHKLRRSGVVSHVRWLWSPLVHIKLRHGLLERQLCVVSHRRRISHMVLLESWGREDLRR